MRIAFICGPPCAGKSTLAHQIAGPDDTVIDYDTIARHLGSPNLWLHPEPWRSTAEHELQAAVAHASTSTSIGTAWVLRTAPRPTTRAALASTWNATVYMLNPGEAECRRRARAAGRPAGTGSHIGDWYHRYRPWHGDLDPGSLASQQLGTADH